MLMPSLVCVRANIGYFIIKNLEKYVVVDSETRQEKPWLVLKDLLLTFP